MANNKTLMYVGIGSGVILLGFLAYKVLAPKEDYSGGGMTGGGYDGSEGSGGGMTGGGSGNQNVTLGQALLNVGSQVNWDKLFNKQGGGSSMSMSAIPDSVPFENTTQGNQFRGWVNDNYSSYANSINLDRTGSYDNSFITKAYIKYGAEYDSRSNFASFNNFAGKTSNYIG